MTSTTTTHKVALPNRILIRTVAGQAVYLDVASLPAAVIAQVFEGGAKVILTNAFNGGGKEATEADKLAQMQKRMDAWARGEYSVTERDSGTGAMREAFVDERRAATGATVKQVEKMMADYVLKAFGEGSKVTFTNVLAAMASLIAKERGGDAADVEQKLTAKYARLADEAAKARAKASAGLDLSDISLD